LGEAIGRRQAMRRRRFQRTVKDYTQALRVVASLISCTHIETSGTVIGHEWEK
jgi:hypothetical protein